MRVRRCDGCSAGTRPDVARRNRAEEAFLRWNGMRNRYWLSLRHNKMVAPMVVDGAMNAETFLAYVEQCLVPVLRHGDIVVMDNVSVHKSPRIREAIENARATLRYLPQYSPDLNPIEMPFSKFKAFLRRAAERTIPGLRRAIRSFLPRLRARECANYFRHAGYAAI